MRNARKGPLCILRTAKALISLRIWAFVVRLQNKMDTVVYVDEQRLSRSDWSERLLILTLAVRIWH